MIEIDWKDIVLRDIRVVGGFCATIEVTKELLELASMKNVKSKIRTFSLDEVNDLLTVYHQVNCWRIILCVVNLGVAGYAWETGCNI